MVLVSTPPVIDGTLDLADNDLIVGPTGSGNLSGVRTLIIKGWNNGDWLGNGITSSTAAAVAASSSIHKTGLGYADGTGYGGSSFDGVSIAATAVIVKYTWFGDANLDGLVNSTDFAIHTANNGLTNKTWTDSDFNYDGTVNALDYNAISTNNGQSQL